MTAHATFAASGRSSSHRTPPVARPEDRGREPHPRQIPASRRPPSGPPEAWPGRGTSAPRPPSPCPARRRARRPPGGTAARSRSRASRWPSARSRSTRRRHGRPLDRSLGDLGDADRMREREVHAARPPRAGACPARSAAARRPASSSTRSRGGTGRRRARRRAPPCSGTGRRPGYSPSPSPRQVPSRNASGSSATGSSADTAPERYHGGLAAAGRRTSALVEPVRDDLLEVEERAPARVDVGVGVPRALSISGSGSIRSMRLVTPARSYSSCARRSFRAASRSFTPRPSRSAGSRMGDRDRDASSVTATVSWLRRRLCDPSPSSRGASAGGGSSCGSGSSPRSSAWRSRRFGEDLLLVLAHPLRLSVSAMAVPRPRYG